MRFFPIIVWFVIIAVGIFRSQHAQAKKQRQAAMSSRRPDTPPVPPQQEATPRSVRRVDAAKAEARAQERRRLIEEKKQAMARRKAAAEAFGGHGTAEEPRKAPVPSAAAVEEEGCHVTPMGTPHVSELRNAKAPAIAHMESHIGEAHGADVHPDAHAAVRSLRRAPTFAFAKTPSAFRRVVVLSEILDRPRAYRL